MVLTTDSTIGIVGLGNLGRPMALNLLDRGWRVMVHDTRPEAVRDFKDAGAVATSALDAADAVCFVVPDEIAVWDSINGGLLHNLRIGTPVVIHSTILPERARELSEAIENAGSRFVMAPVSGGAERARRGELSLIAGADSSTREFLTPLFDAMSRETFHIGDPAAACAVKLSNQLVMFSALAGLHEAMALTQSYGVADGDLLDFLATATGDSWVGRNWGFFDGVAADYERSGVPRHLRSWSKDLWEVIGAAHEARISVPFAATLSQILPALVEDHARHAESAHPRALTGEAE